MPRLSEAPVEGVGHAVLQSGAHLLVHSDAHLLVLDKPAGLLCVPGRGPEKQDCLSGRVQAMYPDALVVHRLDMATSGVCLMARGAHAQSSLSRAFALREVDKRYEAVVDGLVGAENGIIDLPLAADWPNRPRRVVDHDTGKPSLTRWRVLERDKTAHTTRVSLEPITGRSHQLRVHLLAIGHPILGDTLYAPAEVAARAGRLLLHACEISFAHPASGQRLRFASAPPF
jgi:tRNA pseudouridine32 synthase/23S rRNA pseudouridine746 synthase